MAAANHSQIFSIIGQTAFCEVARKRRGAQANRYAYRLHNDTILDHDFVCLFDGRQAVAITREVRFSATHPCRLNRTFGFGIQSRGSFVQNQEMGYHATRLER
ncbi:hypothetical protein ACNKHV_05655 [Shigella flexneri]